MRPARTSRSVTSMSSWLGVTSPLGWLWPIRSAQAPSPIAGWKTSRGCTSDAVAVPIETMASAIARWRPSR
jgi:hypothetical protein